MCDTVKNFFFFVTTAFDYIIREESENSTGKLCRKMSDRQLQMQLTDTCDCRRYIVYGLANSGNHSTPEKYLTHSCADFFNEFMQLSPMRDADAD